LQNAKVATDFLQNAAFEAAWRLVFLRLPLARVPLDARAMSQGGNRWLKCFVCAGLAVVLVLLGWLVPAHLKAMESTVLERAGRPSPGLIQRGQDLASQGKIGAAQLLARAAQEEKLPDSWRFVEAINSQAAQNPQVAVYGGGASAQLQELFEDEPGTSGPEMLTSFMIRGDNREKTLLLLESSKNPAAQALLRCRSLTNTVIFPPSSSAAGQAFDAAVGIAGLLAEEGKLSPNLEQTLTARAKQAGGGGDTQPVEEMLINFMGLGERMNWGQLAELVAHVQDAPTLERLTAAVRSAGERLPVLFAAVEISGRPTAVSAYAQQFSQTGLADLGGALRYGGGGVGELVRSGQRLHVSPLREHLAFLAPNFPAEWRWVALACKFLLYLAGGYLIALALHFAWQPPTCERPLQVRGYHLAREALFALGFVFVVLLLSEPFLAQDTQTTNPTFRLRLPLTGSVVPARTPGANPSGSIMNTINLLTLLLFFLLQALLYCASMIKLSEIRQVNALPRIKLRLLENEEHLFDAGLYLGFVGTIISLILVSLGVIKPSLMAAYSSTSFGIIFVSIFKIFNLRPARRYMLLAAEAQSQEEASHVEHVAAPAYAAP
jgi:hypothetical protein